MTNSIISVAPMLDWTHKHCRYLHRLISSEALLYSEMITTSAILNGDVDRQLSYNKEENPLVLQLGGSNSTELAKCCLFAQDYGYDEVNLNVGCPSDRVQKGRFGACLMKEPELVVDCVQAMQKAVNIPITIKCRIGVDENDSFEEFQEFINRLVTSGVQTIIVHARKAWLKGLSPKQNRSVPPLNYDFVYKIKQLYPEINFVINGGIETLDHVVEHLKYVDGVMLGRAIWTNPWLLSELQNYLIPESRPIDRDDVLLQYKGYCYKQIQKGLKLNWLISPILGLYHGLPGNKKWKSYLVTHASKRFDDISVFDEARECILD